MTQKIQELGSASQAEKRALIRWLLTRKSGTKEEFDPEQGDLQEMDHDLAETGAATSSRPKTTKWVLLR